MIMTADKKLHKDFKEEEEEDFVSYHHHLVLPKPSKMALQIDSKKNHCQFGASADIE